MISAMVCIGILERGVQSFAELKLYRDHDKMSIKE
jgi:hypothetical protein